MLSRLASIKLKLFSANIYKTGNTNEQTNNKLAVGRKIFQTTARYYKKLIYFVLSSKAHTFASLFMQLLFK